MAACLITRPDLPALVYKLLRPICSRLDIWQRETIMPRSELITRIRGQSALICTVYDRIDGEVIAASGNSLKVISTISVGLNHIDLDECRRRAIRVGYTPDVLTDAVAELTIGLLLATARRFGEAERALRG